MFYERNIYFDDVWSQRKHVIFHVHFLYGPRSTSCMGRGIGGSLTPHLPHGNTLTTGYNFLSTRVYAYYVPKLMPHFELVFAPII